MATTLAAAVTGTHKAVVRVDLLDSTGVKVSELTGTTGYVVAGNVTADRSAAIRRQFTFRGVTESMVPKAVGSTLNPLAGYRIQPWRGARLDDGTDDLVSLGVFVVTKSDVTDDAATSALTVDVTGYDLAYRIMKTAWVTPYGVVAGQTAVAAITAMIADRLPGATIDVQTSNVNTVNASTFGATAQNNPWDDIQSIAAAAGLEVFFDVNGRAVIRDEVDASKLPVSWQFIEGTSCTMTAVKRSLDDAGTYNGVIAYAESSSLSAPLRATAWDNNPSSPTYYLGDYGQRPLPLSVPGATTLAQVQAAADTMLTRVLGLNEIVTLSAVPNPSIDVGQAIAVQRARAGVDSTFQVDKLVMPLDVQSPMTLTVRDCRSVS